MYIFKNGKIILPHKILDGYLLAVDNNKIYDIYNDEKKYDGEIIDAKGMYISPGFIDIHVHGGGEGDFLDGDKKSIENIIEIHTKHGTTGMYPTTLACENYEIFKAIDILEEIKKEDKMGAEILGVHLEGPYFNQSQRGAQDSKFIKKPNRNEYMKIFNYSKLIKRMTIAPEIEGAIELVDELKRRNIVASIGHSDAEYGDVSLAYDHGANLVTHLYSGMQVVHRVNGFRKLGIVESAFLIDGMAVEVIADGCHLPIELLKLIYKLKGADKIALITDAMRAAGRLEGKSILGSKTNGQRVILKDGVAYMPDFEAFAGSIATTDRLVLNMYKKVGIPLYDVVKMASLTPAKIMGIDNNKGSLEISKDADIIMFDENISVNFVMTRGKIFNM